MIPRSKKNTVTWDGNMLKVHLTAPPVDGAANEALITVLAARLDVPKRAFQIVQGATARQKIVEIVGLTLAEFHAKLPL